MIWKHRGVQLSLEHYHGVPPGWSGDGIAYMHQTMRPMHELAPIEIGKWGAPSWMTNRYEWLRYKQGLEHVADGIRASCPACCEIAVRYIVIRYIGSYSGYIRAKLARRLRHAPLLDQQKRRLNNHLLALVEDDDLTAEFRDYTKL